MWTIDEDGRSLRERLQLTAAEDFYLIVDVGSHGDSGSTSYEIGPLSLREAARGEAIARLESGEDGYEGKLEALKAWASGHSHTIWGHYLTDWALVSVRKAPCLISHRWQPRG